MFNLNFENSFYEILVPMQGVLGSWIVSPHCKGSELPSTDPLNKAIASVESMSPRTQGIIRSKC